MLKPIVKYKMGNKKRSSMVFLAENGEGTDWMSIAEYVDRISEKTAKRKVVVHKDGVEPVIGRPKVGEVRNDKKVVTKVDKGPASRQAIHYRVKHGFLEKKIQFGVITVREPKAKK